MKKNSNIKSLFHFLFFITILLSYKAKACTAIRAAFDIGSGTTKMKVYEFDTCKGKLIKEIETFETIENGKVKINECGQDRKVSYKEDLKKNNLFNKDTIALGIKALKELKAIAQKCKAKEFSAVATSAFRQASNGQAVVHKIIDETKILTKIISQKEEAIIGFKGAVYKAEKNEGLGLKKKNICMWDIGGSSMQILCQEKNGVFHSYLSDLASVSFKNFLIKSKPFQNLRTLNTPNPIKQEELEFSLTYITQKMNNASEKIRSLLKNSTVLGIGGVHYYAISKLLKLKSYKESDLAKTFLSYLNKTDADLGNGKYVDTTVSNIILVYGVMKNLNISHVNPLKVNLTEGLVLSDSYWSNPNHVVLNTFYGVAK